jgi:HSP20 family protein
MAYTLEFEPWGELLRLQGELERALSREVGWFGLGPSGRGAFPPLNVFSRGDDYLVRMELPGLGAENIAIQSGGDTLTVSGKRAPRAQTEGSVHRRERWTGEFSRSLQLPHEFDPSRARARYEKGVLTIEVPRREEAKPRQISITSA